MTDRNKKGVQSASNSYSSGLETAKQPLTESDTGSEKDFKTQHLSEAVLLQQQQFTAQDKGNAVYLTFILYGIGVLLPFNVIMACLDFYFNTVSHI